MTRTIVFLTANYVARETGFAMHGWEHGDRLTNEAFAPLETFPERIDALIADVARAQQRLGVEWASRLVETTLARLAHRVVAGGARKLVVAGGETSASVRQALGVRALAVDSELAPGVRWMRTLGEPELTVALKSGNFGAADLFLEAVA